MKAGKFLAYFSIPVDQVKLQVKVKQLNKMTDTIKSLDSFKDATSLTALTSARLLQKSEDDLLLSADEIPSWLNESFMENILEKHEKNSKVKCLRIKQCGGKGESYTSAMYRVGTYYCDKNHPEIEKYRSVICKTLANEDTATSVLGVGGYNVQDKEMEMYQRVLPEFRRILESINEDGNFYPVVLAVDKAFDVIVLEDLMDKKYVMADRFTGQDLNHAKMTLRKIARMHAASVIVNQKYPATLAKFDMGIFTRKNNGLNGFFESMCDTLVEEMSAWEGYEYYAKKLGNVRKNLIENCLRVFDCDDGDFHVLNHGDLWTNNMMFCYNVDGTLKDSALIDFQLPVFASPAVDLLYFLFTSTTDEVRENNIEELLQFYYYDMKSLLNRLDYDMKLFPTLQAFQMQISKKYLYVLTSELLVFPVMIGKDKDANFAILMGTDEKAMCFKRTLFKDPRYQKNAKMILPRLDAKGILDEM